MTNKAFEIQGSTLRIGGVDLQAGTTSVVIPGVTQATSYKVEEVNDSKVDIVRINEVAYGQDFGGAGYYNIPWNATVFRVSDGAQVSAWFPNNLGQEVTNNLLYAFYDTDTIAYLGNNYPSWKFGDALPGDLPFTPPEFNVTWTECTVDQQGTVGPFWYVTNITLANQPDRTWAKYGQPVATTYTFNTSQPGITTQLGSIECCVIGVDPSPSQGVWQGNDSTPFAYSYKVVKEEGPVNASFGNDREAITVIDSAEFYRRLGGIYTPSAGYVAATYYASGVEDGNIEEVDVDIEGTFSLADKEYIESHCMWATSVVDPLVSFNWTQWTQVPFAPKIQAGEIETIGGGGGGSGNQLVSNNEASTFALMDEGDVVFDGEGPGGVDRGLVWQYGDNNDGYNSTVRQDGSGLTVRAYTTDGGGGSAGGGEGITGYSAPVNIVTNQDLNQKTWTFDGAGALTFPDGTTQTTAYTGQSGGGSTISKFVMANFDGGVYGSDDGENWSGPFNTGLTILNRVAVGPDMIVYIGGTGGPTSIYYTTAWNATPTEVTDEAPSSWNQVRYFASINKFVAVGSAVPGVPVYKHSTDGITWTTVSLDSSWAGTLNGGDGPGTASFTDIASNGTGFLLTTGNTTLGSFYTTVLTSISIIGSAEWLNDGMDFNRVVYSTNGGFSGWFAFGNGNLGVDDGWWLNSSTNPSGGSFSNGWGISDISQEFADVVNYNPGWSEITIGRTTGASLDTIMIGTEDGQILYWPTEPAGPWISIPKVYTSPIADIVRGTTTTILVNGGQDPAANGEKITISGVTSFDASEPGTSNQSYNGTFYIKNNGGNFELYTDTGLTSPWDTTSYWPVNTDTGTLTWSHGQYIDALNFAGGKFYAGNDDEEVFVSADGGATWTEVAALNPGGGENGAGSGTAFMNDVDGYVSEAVNYQLVNGVHTFTLNNDGTITAPTLTVDLHNGGVQEGQVLQFGDTQQQVIITGPTPTGNNDAQRLIIQGQHGSGTGEGGDVYLWGGDADTNGGDIKIYAGDADNGSSGSGGYVNIDGGNGYSAGGNVTITGGSSTVNGGNVTISGGGGSTPGKVQIQSLYSQWQFKPDGTLQLPTGGDIVDSNGTTVLGGGGTSTNGFVVDSAGNKTASVSNKAVATYSDSLIGAMPSFLTYVEGRSTTRDIYGDNFGFDNGGMWFSGDTTLQYDGSGTPAYPIFTVDSFPADAKSVTTWTFTISEANAEDWGVCVYPANGTPEWEWGTNSTRIAGYVDTSDAVKIDGRVFSKSTDFTYQVGQTYQAIFTYDPVNEIVKMDIAQNSIVLASTTIKERLPKGQDYRIGFDADWDNAIVANGEQSHFTYLSIVVGENETVTKETEFSLTGEVKIPSATKSIVAMNGAWTNYYGSSEFQSVVAHGGFAYMIGENNAQDGNKLAIYKYSLTTGEKVWQKVVSAGNNAQFTIGWENNVYTVIGIDNPGYDYQVGEQLYINGYSLGGGTDANHITVTVTEVGAGGGIISATASGTAPNDPGSNSGLGESHPNGTAAPTTITYNEVTNQLVILSYRTRTGDANDTYWTIPVVLYLSPDDGNIVKSVTLSDEGDINPYDLAFNPAGDKFAVVGEKYNEYRQLGALTIANTANGYFDILKSNLDPEYYPGSATPGVNYYDFYISGTGITGNAQVSEVNIYTGLTATTREGSGALFDITADGAGGYSVVTTGTSITAQITISDLATGYGSPTVNYITVYSDHIVTQNGWDTWLKFPTGALATTFTSLYTNGQVVPVKWAAGSDYIDGYVMFQMDPDDPGTFAITPIDANGTQPIGGTYYFPMVISTVGQTGTNYLPGHQIKVLGTDLGGATPDNDLILTVATANNGAITTVTYSGTSTGSMTYTETPGTNINVGSGIVQTLKLGTDYAQDQGRDNSGSNYVIGDVITFAGTQFFGGASPADDVVMTVSNTSNGGVNGLNYVSGGAPASGVRVMVNGVDFTAEGGAWSMKQSLNGEAFIWTPDWNKAIGGPSNDSFYATTYNNLGDAIWAVGSGYYETPYSQSLVVKFDVTTGDILLSKYLNDGAFDATATSVVAYGNSDVIVSGVENAASPNNKIFVARISATGEIVWKKFYQLYWYDGFNNWSNLTLDPEGNIYVTFQGQDNSSNQGGWMNDGFNVLKLDGSGNIIWDRVISAYGNSTYVGDWRGTRWSSFDVTTNQLVVAGYTYAPNDNSYNSVWATFPTDGFTYFGGEGSFRQVGPWRYSIGGMYLSGTSSATSTTFTPTPQAPTIDSTNDAKQYRTILPQDVFVQYVNRLDDEKSGGLVFGDGSRQTTAANISPQLRAYQDYYLTATDSGKHVYYGPDTNSGTVYLPQWTDSALKAAPLGFTITIINRCNNTINVACPNNSGTIYGSGRNQVSPVWAIPDTGSGMVVKLTKVENGEFGTTSQNEVWMIEGPSDIYSV